MDITSGGPLKYESQWKKKLCHLLYLSEHSETLKPKSFIVVLEVSKSIEVERSTFSYVSVYRRAKVYS